MPTPEGVDSEVAAPTGGHIAGDLTSPRGAFPNALRRWLRSDLAAITGAFLPLGYCLIRGAMGASLWLDEILYYNFEKHPEVRAIELGVPGSFWARRLGPYAYCDWMRGVHGLFDLVGFHVWRNPELFLRLPSLLFFAASVVLLYFLALRIGGDRLWAFGVALAFGSTPGFLFYAFEARVYSFAALAVIAFLACLVLVLEGAGPKVLALGVGLGVLVAWSHPWNACLLAGLGLCLPFLIWRQPRQWRRGFRIAILISLGSALTLLQAAYIFSIRVAGQHGIPFLEPQPWKSVLWSTVYGPFLGLLRGDPEYVLGILFVISIWRARPPQGWCLPAATAIGLALSVVAISKLGNGISPRHQMGLYAGIFVSLAVMRAGYVTKALLANIVGINLVLLAGTSQRIEAKGNARAIAQAIASSEAHTVPVVVQHSYGFGYADPLHSIPLAFYLAGDGLPPGIPVTEILELPTHRDVGRVWIDRDYFVNGVARIGEFSRAPVEEWTAYLSRLPAPALWLVAPQSSPIDRTQEKQYEIALRRAGFVRDPGVREFTGHPPTKLMLWRRAEAH
ncbi:MAG TPA: hypothetical protein VKE50_05135 [Thermoanaerobaculia bacterium]|nr:hypothetical protein [Thermoanaerobaculia bacterium]